MDLAMGSKFMRRFIWLFLLPFLLPWQAVSADVGPKPSMDFGFKQEFSGPSVTITSGVMYECEQSDCQDAKPLQRLGPQGFSCADFHCSAMAYGFSPYHRIEITFSDGKTRRSNIFKTTQFQATYQVAVRQDDLLVQSRFSLNLFTPITYILLCAGCLLGVAILVIVIVLIVRRTARKK
jgi:hypothetical protein